ncbi:MAG: hypothetical protein SFX72_12160 [Isosphaeraceae bacterium]|nr:hypothetical protein [Isosphaeraceae bacterium]
MSVMFLPMNFLAGFFGMNFFGPTAAFESPLPKAALFSATVAAMTIMPIAIWRIGKRRQWF